MPEDQKKRWVQGITQNNAQIVFEALMSNLRKEAKIKIGDALEQQSQSWKTASQNAFAAANTNAKGRFRGLFHFWNIAICLPVSCR